MTYLSETGGRPRPGAGFALWSWFFMRISGLILIFHRWTGPLGAFWRMYDLIMLVFAFTHGMNGVRWVIEDYVRHPGWRLALISTLVVVYVVVLLAGAYIIFAFPVVELE